MTGHNADDIAETVLLNILRGDIARLVLIIPLSFFFLWLMLMLIFFIYRLSRCTFITTGEDGPIPRCKPFKYTYEKEIVIYPYYAISHIFSCDLMLYSSIVCYCPWPYGTYAYFKKLDYFSTECNFWLLPMYRCSGITD